MDLSSLFQRTPRIKEAKAMNVTYVSGPVVTRIAPSPTGPLHIGTARSALFNFLFARKHRGTFIVRIEDTDTARSLPEYEKDILGGLAWLGITHDALYRQSERTAVYRPHIARLLKSGDAFLSKEKSKTNEGEEIEVVRLRNPNRKVIFDDIVRGRIVFDTAELGNFVIARSVDKPLYHLAAVIDDHEMNVTHIIRGEDHISNTPRQILIEEALGFPRPHYAHLPLILAGDKSKMSKRTGTAVGITELKQAGYVPEALVNYLALLGWNPGTPQELFTMDELIESFELEQIGKSGSAFSMEKLEWFNRAYLKKMSPYEFRKQVKHSFPPRLKQMQGYDEKVVDRLIPVLQEKLKSFAEFTDLEREGELDYYFTKPEYESSLLLWKDETDKKKTADRLQTVGALLEHIPTAEFTVEVTKRAVWEYAEQEGRGSVLWPFRAALSGMEKSPDPFTIAHVIGKKETLERLAAAIDLLTAKS